MGEISPNEFEDFISEENMRLDPVILSERTNIEDVLSYFMGKNTPERQEFIIDNLKVELNGSEVKEVFDLEEKPVSEPSVLL